MIMDREAIVTASEIVHGEDFYNKQYGVLFDTMVELNDEGKPVDPVTLQDRLREKDVPPEVCSPEFIRDLNAKRFDRLGKLNLLLIQFQTALLLCRLRNLF